MLQKKIRHRFFFFFAFLTRTFTYLQLFDLIAVIPVEHIECQKRGKALNKVHYYLSFRGWGTKRWLTYIDYEREFLCFYINMWVCERNVCVRESVCEWVECYSVSQAKFAYGFSVLNSSQFSILPQLPQNVRIVKNDSKNNHLAAFI
jgi:hypothetical protein